MLKKIFTILIGLYFCAAANAGSTVNGIEITQVSTLPQNRSHGYGYYDFIITNRSSSQRKVELSIQSMENYFSGYMIGYIKEAVTVPPLKTVTVTLYQPCISLYSPKLYANIDGEILDADKYFGIRLSPYSCDTRKINILVSKSMPGNIKDFNTNLGDVKGMKTEIVYQYADIPFGQWSANWLLYGAYDAIMLTADDMKKMPADIRKALEQYLQLGGILIIYDPQIKENIKIVRSGLGVEFRCSVSPDIWSGEDWKEPINEIRNGFQVLNQWWIGAYSRANSDLKVTEDVKVPVRKLFVFMLIFVIIIGPVNYYMLHKRNKKIWIIWTSPIIAAFFSLIVIVYAICSEGFQARTIMRSLTFLNENDRTASTIASMGYYCPVVPKRLFFSETDEIQPAYERYGEKRALGINLNGGQILEGPWLRSRMPGYFLVRKGEQRRERLQILKRSDEGIEILNGLGSAIENLRVIDFDGKTYFTASRVEPGMKALVLKSEFKEVPPEKMLAELRELFKKNWLQGFDEANRVLLSRGTYCAELMKSPFISPGMEKSEHKEKSVIAGILATEGRNNEN